MKKLFTTIAVAMALVMLVFASPAAAELRHFTATVYGWDGSMDADGRMALTKITSGITYKVLATGSDTAETIYSDKNRTAMTNPVTTTVFNTTDSIDFWCDPTDSGDDQVDLIVTDTSGMYSAIIEDFTYNKNHAVIIDKRLGVIHTGIIWFAHSTTSEQDTGVDFLPDTLISDTRIEVVETCAACTIDVGLLSSETSGDADGFRDGTLLTTAGFVADTGFITAGSSVDYYPDSTYGDLLYKILVGTGVTDASTGGGRTYMGHVVTGANATSLTYTVSSTTSGEGYIYVEHRRLRP